jgi:hypothetical protein
MTDARGEDTTRQTDVDEAQAAEDSLEKKAGQIETGVGEPERDDFSDEGGNGDEPFRNTPVTPNANR